MKKNRSNKYRINKSLWVISILLFFPHIAYNQDNKSESKIVLRTGISLQESFTSEKNYHVAGKLSLNYRFSEFFEPGIYTGYGHYALFPSGSQNNPNVVFYGANLIFHVTPLYNKNSDSKLDIYLIGSYGGFYMFLSDEVPLPKENRPDYGIYAGVDLSISQYLGFFLEAGYGNTSLIKVGLRASFGK